VIGSKLEIAVCTGFIQAARTIHPFEIGSKNPLTPWSIPKVDRIIRFSSSMTSPPTRNPLIQDKCWMWIPIAETHPAYDFILQDFEKKQIIFIQTSTQKPQEHKDKVTGELKVLKAFKAVQVSNPQKATRNLMEKELELFTQEKGWIATYKDGLISATSKKKEWSVKFLFITSVLEDKVKGVDYEIQNMAIIGKEQLPCLEVFWRDSPIY
jgi:hypothetical protein